ncbi:hypothetical protein ACOMHN_021300 [Nucella lapillus]
MVKDEVIVPVDYPTYWCSLIVVVPRTNGDVRICVDLTRLNSSVKREVYAMPAVEETLSKISEGKVFTKIDANLGFYQIPLDDESSKLTTFGTRTYRRRTFRRQSFQSRTRARALFHFGQCLWRNLQSLGLQDWYLEPENYLLVKTIQALAFVPPDDVIEALQQLMDSLDADTDETLSDFLTYFESTWLGIVQRGRRRRPKFDVAMWNVYNRVGDNLPRTNNSVEGWHRAFDQRMSVTHPTLGRLVSKLRKEQASTKLMLEQRAMGVRMRKNKQYEVVNTQLQALVARYAQEDVLVFLKAVAHNL